MIVCGLTGKIICVACCEGRVHDFRLYSRSVGRGVSGVIKILGDSGYKGIAGLHANSETPAKRPNGGELGVVEKAANRHVRSQRMIVECVNAKVKVFKIASSGYRNRCRRFALRMSLLCGIINFENRRYSPFI